MIKFHYLTKRISYPLFQIRLFRLMPAHSFFLFLPFHVPVPCIKPDSTDSNEPPSIHHGSFSIHSRLHYDNLIFPLNCTINVVFLRFQIRLLRLMSGHVFISSLLFHVSFTFNISCVPSFACEAVWIKSDSTEWNKSSSILHKPSLIHNRQSAIYFICLITHRISPCYSVKKISCLLSSIHLLRLSPLLRFFASFTFHCPFAFNFSQVLLAVSTFRPSVFTSSNRNAIPSGFAGGATRIKSDLTDISKSFLIRLESFSIQNE